MRGGGRCEVPRLCCLCSFAYVLVCSRVGDTLLIESCSDIVLFKFWFVFVVGFFFSCWLPSEGSFPLYGKRRRERVKGEVCEKECEKGEEFEKERGVCFPKTKKQKSRTKKQQQTSTTKPSSSSHSTAFFFSLLFVIDHSLFFSCLIHRFFSHFLSFSTNPCSPVTEASSLVPHRHQRIAVK